ncbi:ABC transporter permease [Geomicrobium sp. JCM 19055]|uniref:ABC transporter permease n=1 Tax=Geomicrobium sp. JCM 19055 TaxID=1460649 RepID=UPI002236188F|nr:ABC transporter permease [Geomicrobium sp. JCM 19055]
MFLRFLTKRLLYVIPMLFITTFIVFSFILLIPGDPALAILGENASDENLAQLRAQLGLDQSLLVQYWNWLTSALVGDLGESFFTGESVQEAVFFKDGYHIPARNDSDCNCLCVRYNIGDRFDDEAR